MMTERTYTVSEFNSTVKEVLESAFPQAVWITGEVQRFAQGLARSGSLRWGQIYFELIEKKDSTDELKACVRVVLWREQAKALRDKLLSVDDRLVLQDGLEVRFLCRLDFYAAGGKLQLSVQDIDPHFSLGQMAEARAKLLKKLKDQGLLDKNKALIFPQVPLKVGLITAPGSAAYHDFVNELSQSGYAFEVFLAPASMQGPRTEPEVVRAIKILASEPVDVIVLVRGGGSRSDLSWFDKEGIALSISQCPKPVLTGIGHEIDSSVADLVAHRFFKTPTACAQHLAGQVRAFQGQAEEIFQKIFDTLTQLLEDQQKKVSDFAQDISAASLRAVRQWEQKLATLELRCRLQDPAEVLKKGYSYLTTQNGRPVSSIVGRRAGEKIRAHLADGSLLTHVEEVEGQTNGQKSQRTHLQPSHQRA